MKRSRIPTIAAGALVLGLVAGSVALLQSGGGAAEAAPLPTPPAAAPAVVYGDELPANWVVTGVADGAALDVRSAPDAGEVVGRFAAEHEGIDSTGRVATVEGERWREVKVPGATTGWVAARHLAEMTPPAEAGYDCRPVGGQEVCDTFGESDEGPGTGTDR